MASSAQTINERVIRWSEMRLPHPSRPGSLATWELDGPFAVRPYYRVEGEEAIVRIDHLDQRRDDSQAQRSPSALPCSNQWRAR